MADIKALKDAIWLKKEEIKNEEAGRQQWATALPELLKVIETTGSTEEFGNMQQEIEANVAAHDKTLARLRPELAKLEAQLPQTAQLAAPKFDPAKHPLLRKAVEKQEPEAPVNFTPGDVVEAQWTDKSWYKAKVQSVLGSASAPKYLVRFIEYEDSLTVDRSAVRALPNKRKREEPAAVSSPALPPTPHVISGPVSVNPAAPVVKKSTAVDEEDESKRQSRLPNSGQLKKRKSAWQDFQAKSNKKAPKKESMFRTSTEAGSRVGFTGSGKGMTETHKRQRYDHKKDAENDEEYESKPQGRKEHDSKSQDRKDYESKPHGRKRF